MTSAAVVSWPPPSWSAGPAVGYPPVAWPALVLDWARREPDAIAVRQWDDELSYVDLAVRSAELVRQIRQQGVGLGDRVGVCLRRHPRFAIAVLGVQRAGAAYVPIDPDGPATRTREMLDDAEIDAVIVDEWTAGSAALVGRRLLTVPASGPAGDDGDPGPAGPGHAAYVLYTSGSTGRPKGVVVSHGGVVEFCTAFGQHVDADRSMRALALAAFTFDASIMDIIVPLAVGGQVCLLRDEDRTDPHRLQRFAVEHRVTWGFLPPSLLSILDPGQLPEWRVVLTGAEAPGPEQVARWAGAGPTPRSRFLNLYGPTEATVAATAYQASGVWERPVPIGGPLPNHRVFVVDHELNPVPVGVAGELLIGGPGLALGYLRRPGLTAQRFIPDPFGGEPGARLYRTGDLVSWQPDGTLLFHGRADGQVKVRGQRVEIGEVEAVLRGHPDVGHAVVLALPGAHSLELVACCTHPAGRGVDGDAAVGDAAVGDAAVGDAAVGGAADRSVREWCAARLPAVMVPTRLMWLDRLPLNPSGKVDRAALAERVSLAERATVAELARPGTPVQWAVAAAWQDVLGTPADQLTLNADFFVAGGHSIAAMRLIAALRDGLGRQVSVEDVFAGRTLGGIAERAGAATVLIGAELPSGSQPELSAAQRRLWFIDQLAPDVSAYNIALVERLHGPLNRAALQTALATVARRHDVLRWYLPERGGVPSAAVAPPGPVPLLVDDLRGLSPDGRDRVVRARLEEWAAARFDLAKGPLWRAGLLRVADAEHLLSFTFHHAIFDGWSQRPFFAELGLAYAAALTGEPLIRPPLATSYADYVAWRATRDAERADTDLAWWAEHLAGAPAALRLPTDRPRPAVQTYSGAVLAGTVAPGTAAAVRSLAVAVGATPPTVLLAAFGHLIHRLTGATDVVVGTPTADRRHLDFHDLVGFFIDIVPLRLRVNPDGTFTDSVRAAVAELLDALAHPGAPLERIVETLGLPRDPARPPLVQVLFNAYNFAEPRLELAGVRAERGEPGLAGSPFDLTCYIVERDRGFTVELLYNTDLFDAARIRAVLDGFLALLDHVCADPAAPVSAAQLPSLAELAATGTPTADPTSHEHAQRPGADPTDRAVTGPVTVPTNAVPTNAVPTNAVATNAVLTNAVATNAVLTSAVPTSAVPTSAVPTSATELLVAQAWCEVLGRAEVGAVDNFFAVGGTSLAVVAVRSRLGDLTGREVSIVDMFRFPTVRALAHFLDDADGEVTLDRGERRVAARRERMRTRTAAPRSQPSQPSQTSQTSHPVVPESLTADQQGDRG